MVIFTTNKKRLLKHFQRDPVLFAYHIGDLDDFYFADCLWPSVANERSGLDDVLLTYFGGDTPTLLAFGLSDRFPDLLRDYLPLTPKRFFCHFQKPHGAVFGEFAHETPLGTHLKMKLDEKSFAGYDTSVPRGVRRPGLTPKSDGCKRGQAETPDLTPAGPPVRLDTSHETALRRFYAAAHPDNYFVGRMLQTGKYFGCMDQDEIVAVAGVHVDSVEHRIAVLGNITTHPEHRGCGLATELTRTLAAELVSEGKMVCLNVKADNVPAIACYRKLGFVPVHKYDEALFELK